MSILAAAVAQRLRVRRTLRFVARLSFHCVILTIVAGGLMVNATICADDAPQQAGRNAASEREGLESATVLIERLTAADFRSRREAFLALWELGDAAIPALQQAAASNNRQLADSVNTLLVLDRLDVQRDSRSVGVLVDLLTNLDASRLVELCELGEWTLAAELFRGSEQLKGELKEDYEAKFLNGLIELALDQQDVELVWPIVAEVGTPETAAWLAQRLEFPLPEIDGTDRELVAVRKYFAGEIDEAIELTQMPNRLVPMVTRSFRWDKLSDKRFQEALLGPRTSEASMAAMAVLAELAGDPVRAAEIWDELLPASDDIDPTAPSLNGQEIAALTLLRQQGDPLRGNGAVRNQLMLALLMAGQVVPVEQYLKESNSSWAYSFYAASSNYVDAFEQMGLDTGMSEFDQWLENQRQLIRNQLLGADGLTPNPSLDSARVAAALHGLGEFEKAEQIVETLAQVAQDNPNLSVSIWQDNILRWLSRHESRYLCMRIAIKYFASMNLQCQEAVLEGLYPEFGEAALALYDAAPRGVAASDLVARRRALPADLPNVEVWESLESLHTWDREYFGANAEETVSRWLRTAKQRQVPVMVSSDSLNALAKTAIGFGYDELAFELLATDLTEIKDSKTVNIHWLTTAQLYLDQFQPAKATERLRSLRTREYCYQPALVTEIQAMLQVGDVQQAEQLSKSRWMRFVCNPWYYGAQLSEIGRHYNRLEDYTQAREYMEPAFLFSEASSRFLYFAMTEYSTTAEEMEDYKLSADVQRATLVEGLQPYSTMLHFLIANGYVSSLRYAVAKERLTRAAVCVGEGKIDEAARHIEITARLQPLDIETVIQCYPKLVASGHQEMAEELLVRYETELERQLELWPKDATSLNNTAWMYSQCDIKLDRALELAQQAVALAPSSPVFLDTFAEVQFRRGDVDAAIESMRGCVKLDPRDKHYRENLVRFSSSSP